MSMTAQVCDPKGRRGLSGRQTEKILRRCSVHEEAADLGNS